MDLHEQERPDYRIWAQLNDEDFIREADLKSFLPDDIPTSPIAGARLVREILQQDYQKDYKLSKTNMAVNNVPRHEFPFNKHTVTIGVGNVLVDFETARAAYLDIREKQIRIAEEIERAKEEMERVRLVEQAWYDDFTQDKYVNDLTYDVIKKEREMTTGQTSAVYSGRDEQDAKNAVKSPSDSDSLEFTLDDTETDSVKNANFQTEIDVVQLKDGFSLFGAIEKEVDLEKANNGDVVKVVTGAKYGDRQTNEDIENVIKGDNRKLDEKDEDGDGDGFDIDIGEIEVNLLKVKSYNTKKQLVTSVKKSQSASFKNTSTLPEISI